MISYLAPDPIAECADQTMPGIYRYCTESEACNLIKTGGHAKIYFDTDGWSKKYSMVCDKSGQREMSLTLLLVINSVVAMLVLLFSDIYGRLFGMWATVSCLVVGTLMGVFVDDFMAKMVGLGILVCTEVAYTALFTVYVTEITSANTKLRSFGIGLFFLGYGLGCVVINFFAYISTDANFLLLLTSGILAVGGDRKSVV